MRTGSHQEPAGRLASGQPMSPLPTSAAFQGKTEPETWGWSWWVISAEPEKEAKGKGQQDHSPWGEGGPLPCPHCTQAPSCKCLGPARASGGEGEASVPAVREFSPTPILAGSGFEKRNVFVVFSCLLPRKWGRGGRGSPGKYVLAGPGFPFISPARAGLGYSPR